MLIEFWRNFFLETDKEFSATKPKIYIIVGTLLYKKNVQHESCWTFFNTTRYPRDLVSKQFVDKDMTMLLMLLEFWNKHFLDIDEEFSAPKPKLCLIVQKMHSMTLIVLRK